MRSDCSHTWLNRSPFGSPDALQAMGLLTEALILFPSVGAFYLSCLSFLPAVCFENPEAQGLCSSLWESIVRFGSIFSVVSKDMVSFSDVIKPLLGGCNPRFKCLTFIS